MRSSPARSACQTTTSAGPQRLARLEHRAGRTRPRPRPTRGAPACATPARRSARRRPGRRAGRARRPRRSGARARRPTPPRRSRRARPQPVPSRAGSSGPAEHPPAPLAGRRPGPAPARRPRPAGRWWRSGRRGRADPRLPPGPARGRTRRRQRRTRLGRRAVRRRAHGPDEHLHGRGAVPLVARTVGRRRHGGRRRADRRPRPPCPNHTARQRNPPSSTAMRRWRPSPIRSTPCTEAAGASRVTPGLPEPERLEAGELVGQLERGLGRGEHGVDALARLHVGVGQLARGVLGERVGERLDIAGRDRQPRGDAVAAVAAQMLPAGGEAGVQVVGGDAPPRALRLLPALGDQDDRAAVALDQPRRDDPDDTLVPVRRGRARRPCVPATPRRGPRAGRRRRAGSCPRPSAARGSAPRAGLRAPARANRRSVSRSSSASPGWHRRPAALMRGASRKPTSEAPMRARSTRAVAISARRPGRVVRARRRSPARTRPRFSSTSGTTSAIVASATRSRWASSAAGSRPAWAKSAWASLKTTPVPDSSGNGYSDGRVHTSGQSGRTSPGRWWSVTITSMPSSAARVTWSAAVIPQSTVTSRRDAVGGEPVDRLGGQAVAFVEAARHVPVDLGTQLAQRHHGQRGGADPVGVVVAVHADPLAGGDRPADPLARRRHVAEEHRVVQRPVELEERPRRSGSRVPAADEHLGRRTLDAELCGEVVGSSGWAGIDQPAWRRPSTHATEGCGRDRARARA